ncbi:MAG: DUF6164 family protein [Marinobacter sp.]|nr:DUF6164 family protein [Marinobacter sp.]
MPYQLMNLRHVPDDEADEIRALFEAEAVIYYETPPSRWGISMGGFWVHDAEEAARAKTLLQAYQRERLQRQRESYDQEREAGQVLGFWGRIRHRPLTTLMACLAMAMILALTLAPYLNL